MRQSYRFVSLLTGLLVCLFLTFLFRIPDSSVHHMAQLPNSDKDSVAEEAGERLKVTHTPYVFESYLSSTVLKPGDSWGLWEAFPSKLFQLEGVASGTQRQFELAPVDGCYALELEWDVHSVRQFSFTLIDRVGRPIYFAGNRTGKVLLELVPSIYRVEVEYSGTINKLSTFALRAAKVSRCTTSAAGWIATAPDIPRYQIIFRPAEARLFEAQRFSNEQKLIAIGAGTNIKTTNFKIKATILQDGFTEPTRVKISPAGVGDLFHFKKEFPSMTVVVTSGPLLYGMRKFKLYNLRASNGLLDYTTTGLATLEGLLVPRQKLVSVSIQGRDAGLYVVMELPSQEFLFHKHLHSGKFEQWERPGPSNPLTLPGYAHPNLAYREMASVDSSEAARFTAFATRLNATHGINGVDTRFFHDKLLPTAYPVMRDVNINYWADNGLGVRSFISHSSFWLMERFEIAGPHSTPTLLRSRTGEIEFGSYKRYFYSDRTLGVQGTTPFLDFNLRFFEPRQAFDKFLVYYGDGADYRKFFRAAIAKLGAIVDGELDRDPLGVPGDITARFSDPFSGVDVSVAKAVPSLLSKARLIVFTRPTKDPKRQLFLLYNFSAFSMEITSDLLAIGGSTIRGQLGLGPARLYAYLENDLDGAEGIPPMGRMTRRVANVAVNTERALGESAIPGVPLSLMTPVLAFEAPVGILGKLLSILRSGVVLLAGAEALPAESIILANSLPEDEELLFVPAANRNGETSPAQSLSEGLVLLPAGSYPILGGSVSRFLVLNEGATPSTVRIGELIGASSERINPDVYQEMFATDVAWQAITQGAMRPMGNSDITLPAMKRGPVNSVSGLLVDGMAGLMNGSANAIEESGTELAVLEIFFQPCIADVSECKALAKGRPGDSIGTELAKVTSNKNGTVLDYYAHRRILFFEQQKASESVLDYTHMSDPAPVLDSRSIDSILVFGREQTVHIKPGATLTFGPNGGLLIFGRLVVNATEDQPINLIGNHGGWSGVAVVNDNKSENEASILRNVNIEGIRKAPLGPIAKLGGLQFVRTSVILDRVNIKNISAEDGVNFYKSYVEMKNVSLSNAVDDCIDFDWSVAKIRNLKVEGCGGDAIDLNNTLADMAVLSLDGYGDKGISVGEASSAEIRSSKISGGALGAAIKDLSILKVAFDVESDNHSEDDFAIYVKNPSFGLGYLKFIDGAKEGEFNIINHGTRIKK